VTREIIRIQRQRSKGWKMPPGAIYVGRPTKWGNPFTLDVVRLQYPEMEERAVKFTAAMLFKRWLMGKMNVDAHRFAPPSREEVVAALQGKDLVCWCKPEEPCHADVLIWFANTEPPPRSRQRVIDLLRSVNDAVVGHPVGHWMHQAAEALADPKSSPDPHRGSMQWILEGTNTQSEHIRELAGHALYYLEGNDNG